MKRRANKVITTAVAALLTVSSTGCQQITQLKFHVSGSSVPRNPQEEVIFNYFQALKEERYEDAYQLRANREMSSEAVSSFREKQIAARLSLPDKIAISDIASMPTNDDDCGYIYTIYTLKKGQSLLHSGNIVTESDPNRPGECLIGYSSAFGGVP